MNWGADLRTLDGMNRVAAPVTPKKRKRSESGAEPGDQGDQALTPTRKRLTPEERVHTALQSPLLCVAPLALLCSGHMHAYPLQRPTGGSTRTERRREAEEGRREEKEGGGARAQEEGARGEGTTTTTQIASTLKCGAHGNALRPSCAMLESAEGAGEGQERRRTRREEEAQRGRKGQEGRGEEEERGGQEEEGRRGQKKEGGRQAEEGGGQKEERGGEEKEGGRAHQRTRSQAEGIPLGPVISSF